MSSFLQGALEHHNSSVYYSGIIDTIYNEEVLIETIGHEFLHILMPLNLHSDRLYPYDFQKTNQHSGHLWLYEGITEYLSVKNILAAGLIDTNEFFQNIWNKNIAASNYKKASIYEMSQDVLTKKGQDYYGNVYDKGALIGFYLDYLISKKSDGQKGLNDLLLYLIDKYGQDKAFKEEEFITEITTLFPETKVCFDHCVYGNLEVPVDSIYHNLNIQKRTSNKTTTYYSYGFKKVKRSKDGQSFAVQILDPKNNKKTLHLKVIQLDNKKVNELSIIDFFAWSRTNDPIKMIYLGQNNEHQSITCNPIKQISANTEEFEFSLPHPDQNQMKIIQQILSF